MLGIDEAEKTTNSNEAVEVSDLDARTLDSTKADNLVDWKNVPTISNIKEDLEYARTENNDQCFNVAGWLELRNATGKESGNKSKEVGRSKIQPKLIRKHNEWRYPGLSEPFLNTDRMFEVKPRTFEDTHNSKQNQVLLNWQFDTKISRVNFIDRYVRTTVDEGTCIVRTGWDRKTYKHTVKVPVYDYYPMDLDDVEGIQAIQQATQLYLNDPEGSEYVNLPDTLQASVEYGLENQQLVSAEFKEYQDEIKEEIVTNQPSLTIVDVRNFFIDPSCKGDWEKAKFMIYTYESTKSDLSKKRIYDNLEKVDWSANTITSEGGNPDHTSDSPLIDTRSLNDKSPVLVYEYWGYFDIYDTGELVPIVVSFIGNTIIQMIENPFPDKKPPFVIVPYMPILKSSFGEADASLLQDNQRIQGGITRGMIDILGRSANGQTGYPKGFLDSINKQRFMSGHDFEYNPNQDPKIAIKQMTYPELPNSALQMNALQNQEAESLSGVKGFAAGISGDSFGKVARGITNAMDAADLRELSIVRRLAEGMQHIGKKLISMNQVYLTKKEIVRVTNKEFVEVLRDDLAGNFDLVVDISTASQDQIKSEDLGMLLQTVGPDMDPGLRGIILAKIAMLKRMPDLAEQILSYKPEPDPMVVKMQELEMQKLLGEIELNVAKAEEAKAKAENVRIDTALNASGTKHQRDVEKQGAQARGNRDLAVTNSLLDGETPVGNIEAAVGYNTLKEIEDTSQGTKPAPAQPDYPV